VIKIKNLIRIKDENGEYVECGAEVGNQRTDIVKCLKKILLKECGATIFQELKMVMKIETKDKFVIIEHQLFDGWIAIEGDENDQLITYDSFKEAEQELKGMIREFINSGLEGYCENSEEFKVIKLDNNIKLRDGLTR